MQRTPLWMTIVIIIVSLPAFTFPALLDSCPPEAEATRTLVWIYPFTCSCQPGSHGKHTLDDPMSAGC